ncbi:hypothetical protein J4206_02505 [Candidatus Woesearchaeota archaeon]|nr:hypothetical protein [Candidatus Woesearchaeota archaeon]
MVRSPQHETSFFMRSRVCTFCHGVLEPDAEFCSRCHAKVIRQKQSNEKIIKA